MYRLTDLAKHHFFGFHDLLISNKEGNKLLALQVDVIDHPPRKNQPANIGFVETKNKRYVSVGQTFAWNFPQGARQQWVGDSNKFIVNDLVDNVWGSCLYDSETQKIIEKYNYHL